MLTTLDAQPATKSQIDSGLAQVDLHIIAVTEDGASAGLQADGNRFVERYVAMLGETTAPITTDLFREGLGANIFDLHSGLRFSNAM